MFLGDSQSTVSLLFDERREANLHVFTEQDEQTEEITSHAVRLISAYRRNCHLLGLLSLRAAQTQKKLGARSYLIKSQASEGDVDRAIQKAIARVGQMRTEVYT